MLLLWRVWRKSQMRTCYTFYSIFTSKPVHHSSNNMRNRKIQLNWKGDIGIRKKKHLTLWHPLPSSSPTYYANTTSSKLMQDVLVITLPQRNYTRESTSVLNNTVGNQARLHAKAAHVFYHFFWRLFWIYFLSTWQINDYVAGYHDGALLFGKVLREKMLSQRNQRNKASQNVPLSDNPFSNISFNGR